MKNYKVILGLLVVLFAACSDETTVYDLQNEGKALVIEESSATLSSAVNNANNGVLGIYFEHENYEDGAMEKSLYQGTKNRAINGRSNENEDVSNASSDFRLNLVGQIQSPQFDGFTNLTATHIDYQDNFAYVSYNTIGEEFAGAIDIIDLSDPLSPVLASRMYMYDRDANVVLFDNGYLYVIGVVNTERVLEATAPSFVGRIGVNNGIIDLEDVTYFYQEGRVATSITKMDNSFFVTSGIDGVIAKYNATDFSKVNEVAFNDLRWVASGTNRLAVLDGAEGVIVFDAQLNEISRISTKMGLVAGAKRTIAIKDDKLVVSEGNDGAAIFNLDTGALEERLPILIDPENVIETDKVTNAVAVNGDVTLLANGGAGLAIRVQNDLIDLMGVVELRGSINYVAADEDYIFAASGTSGLQIISKIRTRESMVVPEGNYVIRARHSGRALGLQSLSFDDNIRMQQRSLAGDGVDEIWYLEVLASGAYVITSDYSSKAATSVSTNVRQVSYLGGIAQQWAFEPAAEEGYFYVRNLDDNRYLDVFGNRRGNAVNMITWPFHGRNNQQFELEPLD